MSQQDSPLSIAASITGILTFVAAVIAGFYARAISLKHAIDTQAEISNALEKIDNLETETNMLNNAYLASQIRQPERKYGSGDFKYFQGLYTQCLQRMRGMDYELRQSTALITSERYDKISRLQTAATWMTARDRIHKAIEERKAEGTRIFQIQLAMLSAKIDELSYHQNHHNVTCSVVVAELGSLQSGIGTSRKISSTPPLSTETPDKEAPPVLARISPSQSSSCVSRSESSDSCDYHQVLVDLDRTSSPDSQDVKTSFKTGFQKVRDREDI